jgi:hypothetical protein
LLVKGGIAARWCRRWNAFALHKSIVDSVRAFSETGIQLHPIISRYCGVDMSARDGLR